MDPNSLGFVGEISITESVLVPKPGENKNTFYEFKDEFTNFRCTNIYIYRYNII